MQANCSAGPQNLPPKARPRFARMVVSNPAREIVRDMKAPSPLAQLTVPRGTDLVKPRSLAPVLLLASAA